MKGERGETVSKSAVVKCPLGGTEKSEWSMLEKAMLQRSPLGRTEKSEWAMLKTDFGKGREGPAPVKTHFLRVRQVLGVSGKGGLGGAPPLGGELILLSCRNKKLSKKRFL